MLKEKIHQVKSKTDENYCENQNFDAGIVRELNASLNKYQEYGKTEVENKKNIKFMEFLKNFGIMASTVASIFVVFFVTISAPISIALAVAALGVSATMSILAQHNINIKQNQIKNNRLDVIKDALNTHFTKDFWHVKELAKNPQVSYEILAHAANYEYNWFKNDQLDSQKVKEKYIQLYCELNPYTEAYKKYVQQCSNSPYPVSPAPKFSSLSEALANTKQEIEYFKLGYGQQEKERTAKNLELEEKVK